MTIESIAQLRGMLDRKEISSVEACDHFIERTERFEPNLNAFITESFERAREEAKRADEMIAKGEASGLTGIPIAHKDLLCTKGVRTSGASKMLDNFIAPYDASVVEKMNREGVVSLGKLNLDEFAMGSTGETSFYGVTKNPWDESRVAGGSSSGSAAAVSAGLVLGATASDTGGSIRQPASFCGVTGIKPTYGRVSRYGAIAFASSLDQLGAIGRSAEDCAYLLQGMAGFDPKDPTSMEATVPNYVASLQENSLAGKKIGIVKEFFGAHLDDEIRAKVDAALKEYEAMGAELVPLEFKHHHLVTPIYYVIATAEASSNLSRYDGVRYGYRCENPLDLEDLYRRTRGEGFGMEVKSRVMMGTLALTEEYYHSHYLQAQKIRRLIAEEYRSAFESVDFLAGPTVPTTAFAIGAEATGIENSLFDANLIGANFAGLPALSHPIGFVDQMPVGMQLIGRAFDEAGLLAAAHHYQNRTDWHLSRPEQYK